MKTRNSLSHRAAALTGADIDRSAAAEQAGQALRLRRQLIAEGLLEQLERDPIEVGHPLRVVRRGAEAHAEVRLAGMAERRGRRGGGRRNGDPGQGEGDGEAAKRQPSPRSRSRFSAAELMQ